MNLYICLKDRLGLQTNAWIPGADKVQQLITVFAHEGFQMMAGNVVPFDTVLVEVVQDGQTGFVVTLSSLSVVRLSLSKTTSGGPVPCVSLSSGSNLGTTAGPEPSVHIGGLQVGSVATVEVTFAARGPDVTHVASSQPLLDELVLLRGFQTDGIHTMASTDVSSIQPVDF
uniref:Uncharacterized protein n=1 Tax=Cacopsylla melanoneura TaxID=428564 RepID=A0A8D9BSQ0_9HEMI